MLPALLLLLAAPQDDLRLPGPYRTARYGFEVEIPPGFRAEPPPTNGDGRTFVGPEGCTLTVFGSNNVLDTTLQGEARALEKEFAKVTYRAKGPAWVVRSGLTRGGDVLYIKAYVGTGSLAQLWIQHPAAALPRLKALTARVAASFGPGDLDAAH